jgi:hypothetical protein
MGCYEPLSASGHPSPLSNSPSPHLASVAPPAATLSGLAGGGRPLPPSHTTPKQDYSQILAASAKVEDGLHLGACEYGS